MKKNKEWAFIELGKLFPSHAEMYDYPDNITVMKCELLNKVYDILSQLDEPETLSQEWVNGNSVYASADGVTEEYVHVDDLKELLVPQQELPVIPNYVAKWISVHHERFDLYPALKKMENNARSWERIYDWYRKNTHKFVNAYLTGKYEVGGEQKYYVLDSEDIPLLEIANNQTCKTTTGLSIYEDGRDNSRFELTEQEIKDYDKRFWPFAVKVEELKQ